MTTIEALKNAQELLKLNQREFGVYAGVSARTVNSWMTGDRACPAHVAELIRRIAAADYAALLNGEETSRMERWCLIRWDRYNEYVTVYGSKVDALREAQHQWDRLTAKEKKECEVFQVAMTGVCLCDRTVDGPFARYSDSTGEVAKDWK